LGNNHANRLCRASLQVNWALDLTMAASKKLDTYRGKLSPAQIAEGMNAAVQNARLLMGDAKLLLEHKRFPTAMSLAILAIEEDGKTALLRYLAISSSDEEVKDAWKSYRSHTQKNIAWILPDLARRGARKIEDMLALVDKNSDHPPMLDQAKQLGFYTDCLGDAHWSIPAEVVSEELAKAIVETADVLVSARKTQYTTKEVELWIQHMGPALRKGMPGAKQALVDWYVAMQAHGLEPEGENKMEPFVT
jgi:AbiV family abortive infection protein